MERKISELLDDLYVEDVKLTGRTPLSTYRIREKTLKRIGARKTVGVRWFGRIAAVAAVIMLLTLTAFAAENIVSDNDWVSAVFDNPLTVKQKQVVESLEKDFSNKNSTQPVTGDGVTITPISAVCDNRICYLHVRVEAREGIVLPDLPENQTYSFSGGNIGERMQIAYYQYNEDITNVKVTTLPDEDPTDNIKEFVLEMHADWYVGFNGQRVSLKFYGLWIKEVNKLVYKNVFKCDQELGFTVGFDDDRIDIKDTGLSIYNEPYDFTVNLERVYITHLRVVIHYTATSPNDAQEIVPDGGVCRVVMKDGTSILLGDQSKVSDGEMVGYFRVSKAEELTGLDMTTLARELYLDNKVELCFDEPITPEDIDYIVWCGDQIIDIN